MDQSQVVDKAYKSVKWVILSSILPRLITPISTLVLAALLIPRDFGVVAAATVVIALAQILMNMGIGLAIIQRREEVSEAATLALGLNVFVALGLYAILWVISPEIARAYHTPELATVLRVVSLSLILSSLLATPMALLQKEMAFRRLFWIGATPLVVGACVSVGVAAFGGGYWALVAGNLAGLGINLGLAWKACRWRPRAPINLRLLPELFRFSLWITISSLLSWLFLYADNALAGYFFGASVLGAYALGFNLANLMPALILAPLSSVAYPAFCALQNEGPREIGLKLVKVFSEASAVVIPVCLGASALAVSAVRLLYGDRWPGLGMTIQWMAIMPGISNLWSLYADAFRSVGRPDVWAKLAFVSVAFLFALIFLAGRSNFPAFVVARSAGAWLYPVLSVLVARRILKITIREQLRALGASVFLSLLMYAVVLAFLRIYPVGMGLAGWGGLAAALVLGVFVYGIFMRVLKPGLYNQLSSSVRRALSTA